MVVGVTAAAELGALRHIDDAKRAAAMALVREGRLFDLSRELHEGIPVFPGRHFKQTLVPNPGPPLGANEVDWTTEIVTSTMQVGTPLDALCHLRQGAPLRDATPSGFTRDGVETAPQFVTRGWLVDAAPLGPGDVSGLEHVRDIAPAPGDAVLFHTGWGRHWDDPDTYVSGEPGPGM